MKETLAKSLEGEDLLENHMATQSNILACVILWTEEPGELLSIDSQKGCT